VLDEDSAGRHNISATGRITGDANNFEESTSHISIYICVCVCACTALIFSAGTVHNTVHEELGCHEVCSIF
jgi:hypothetical protein